MAKAASAAEINNLFILVSSSHVENAKNVIDRRKFLAGNEAIWLALSIAKPRCGCPLRQLANACRLNHTQSAIHCDDVFHRVVFGGFMLAIHSRLCRRALSAALA